MAALGQLVNALLGVETVRYAELASSMIILYDHLITFDQEVNLIWKAGWSYGKTFFLLNRYYTLLVVIFNNYVIFGPGIGASVSGLVLRMSSYLDFVLVVSTVRTTPSMTLIGVSRIAHSCIRWFRWQGATGVTAFILGELILQLRLYALYDLNKKVLLFMGFVFVSAIVASSAIMGYALAHINVLSVKLYGWAVCAPLNLETVPYFYAFWIPMLISESVLCALALWRAFRGYRRKTTLAATGRALLAVLIRDSILYFLVMFVVYLVNLFIFLQNNVTYTESAVSYSVSMSCVLGSRLCLNVRGMVWQDDDIMTGHNTSVHPTVPAGLRVEHASHPWNIVITGHSKPDLTEYEMDELRTMRLE